VRPFVVALVLVMTGCELAGFAAAQTGSSLAFNRQDGSRISFPGTVRAWCDRDALHVITLGGIRESRWQLSLARRTLHSARAIDFTWRRTNGVELFVFDAKTKNEASESAEGSRGHVVLLRNSCTVGAGFEIGLSAVVASEFFDGARVRVSGTLQGKVGRQPHA
jgi:hypothetical protein